MSLGKRPRLGYRPLAKEGPSYPYVMLWRPYSQTGREHVILSHQTVGAVTHWDGSRSIPHHRRTRRCEGCRLLLPKRWWCYLSTLLLPEKQRVILQLSEIGFGCVAELAQLDGGLRGLCLMVSRIKEGKQAAHLARCLATRKDAHSLPPAHDVGLVLGTLWGLTPAELHDVLEIERVDLDRAGEA